MEIKRFKLCLKSKRIGLDNKLDGGNKWGNTEKEGEGKKIHQGFLDFSS